MSNPHGFIALQFGKNQADAVLSVMSRGLDEIQAEIDEGAYNPEYEAEAKVRLDYATTSYSKIRNAMKGKGWLDEHDDQRPV